MMSTDTWTRKDVLAGLHTFFSEQEQAGTDPEPLAHALWAQGVTVGAVRVALKGIAPGAEWPEDVLTAVRWAYKHNQSPLTTTK